MNETGRMDGVAGLIRRVLPEHFGQVRWEVCAEEDGKDVYEVDWEEHNLILRGNNAVSIAAALGHYLKYTAKVNLSWCGSDFYLPDRLPKAEKYRRVIEQKYRVYMNYCTFQYSAAWWDFPRWEREIDYMALNGVNMPLCMVGVEGIWYHTLQEFGFSEEEAREYLAGPAFLAWQWMGNLEGFGGPLPKSWIEKRIRLGREILERVTELGMMPVQQGFSGCVPVKLAEKFPGSSIALKEPWCGMHPTAQLDPTDSLFRQIGRRFMEIQKKIFGTYGFYTADPFHEGEPPVAGEDYLGQVGKSIAGLFEDFDRKYLWIMQAWSIRKEIVRAVPKEKLLILDLGGESYRAKENFWGYPFVQGNLHNFGGRTKLHGDLRLLAENAFRRIRQEGCSVVGTGLFMEGIGQNPVYYDLAFEMLTRNDEVCPEEWIKGYLERRYKTDCAQAAEAWKILLDTVYARGTNGVEKSSMICARPAVHVKKSGPNDGFRIHYDLKRLLQAIMLLLKTDSATDGYAYDMVDLTRQYLSDYAYYLNLETARRFQERDKVGVREFSERFLELLSDVDRLLDQREEFRFDRWIADAVKWGETEEEKALLDYNATALVTIWGREEEAVIFDYAWREWSGLTGQYYKMRWQAFFDMLAECLEEGTEYSEENLPCVYGRESWRANSFYSRLADQEIAWIRKRKQTKPRKQESIHGLISGLIKKYDGFAS